MYKLITESKDIPDNFTGIVEYANGDRFWFKEGKWHRLDGPAIEFANGDKCWYKEDKLHRLEGPAIEYADGTKYWYKEGKLHRLDGPAIEGANGDKSWYIEGKQYSEEEFLNLTQKTCKGKLVEIDGKKYRLVPVD